MKKSGPKELKFINYKRYIIVLSVLLTALISINIMFRVSTVLHRHIARPYILMLSKLWEP